MVSIRSVSATSAGAARGRLGPLLALALLAGLPAAAEEEAAEAEPKLQVHGFLSQAYAASDGNQILGIPEEGTSDYRTAAVQFRYQMAPRDLFVFQLAHERLGESPLAAFREDVEVDWVFYQRQLGERTSVKVGKVPIPLGIYNEIRDVGTVLPFYRPPETVYGEATLASETVDGFLVSHTFFGESAWRLQAEIYYGGWETIEPAEGEFAEVSVDDGLGGQLWLATPLSWLRLGLAGQQMEVSGGLLRPPDQEDRWEAFQASAEASFARFRVRAEFRHISFEPTRAASLYGQLGMHATSRLDLNLQAEIFELEASPAFTRGEVQLDRDLAASARFALSSRVVVRLEIHRNKGYRSEDPRVPFSEPAAETTYGILSVAAAF